MKNLVLAVLLMAAAAPARATSTSRLLGLDIIPVGTLSWGPRDNNRIYQISSAAASQYDSNTFGLNGSTQTSRGAWLFNNGSSITFATGSAFYLAPGTAYTSTITAAGIAEAYGVTASTMGIGGSPSGTRKFQVYFNANNNSPSYGDGAVRYLDSVNGVGFECGALYGGSQPSWCQSGNDGMGTKKPFVFQPDGSNVGIRTLSPATTAALEVAGPVSVGGSGNTQYSLQASSGIFVGLGGVTAPWFSGDGSHLTGIGGGGLSSMQIASGTVSGGNIGTAAGPLLTATSFYLDSAGLTLTQSGNAAIIGVKNIMAVATASSFPGGTSATSVLSVCLPNSTATWNSGNNPALLCYAGSGNTTATVDGQAAILLDGVIVSSVSARAAIAQANLSQCVVTSVLSAGSHSACLAAATNDGSTMVVPGASSSKSGSKLSVVEINTSGSGYSAPASSFTYVPSFAATDTLYSVCRATVTLTTSGGPVAVYGTGGMSDNNANSGVGVLVDGQFVNGETSAKGLGPCSNASASVATNCAFGPITVTGLSAGTHNVCLTVKTDGTLTNPPANVTTVNYGFGATEIRNAAGTGDVSSNGNNGFSGNNTHSGTEAFNSTATFTVSPSSNTAPTPNALYSMFIPKMAAIFDSTASSVTTYGAINVSSATRAGAGLVRFTLVTPMSARYMCICSARNNSGNLAEVCELAATTSPTNVDIQNSSVTPSANEFFAGGIVQCWDYGATKQ
jgi:hypothetical protein